MNRYFLIGIIGCCIFHSCRSQTDQKKTCGEKIVIINSGFSNRIGISRELEIINRLSPKVVGIDFQFSGDTNFYQDSLLTGQLNKCKRLVMFGVLEGNYGIDSVYEKIGCSESKFLANAELGFANALLESDEFRTLKKFSTYE